MRKNLYQQELRKIRKLAKEFAGNYPSIAPMLLQESADPDVERLLEGLAYLSADLQGCLVGQYDELISSILRYVSPKHIHAIPSSVMQAFIANQQMPTSVPITKGTYVDNGSLAEPITFSTVEELSLQPFNVISQGFNEDKTGAIKYSLDCLLSGGTIGHWMPPETMHFFISGAYSTSSDFYYVLLRYCDRVIIEVEGEEDVYLPVGSLTHHLNLENVISKDAHGSGSVSLILQDYFTFAQQFLRVTLKNFNLWKSKSQRKKFKISFSFPSLPEWFEKDEDIVMLTNVVPCENLFPGEAKPMHIDHTQTEYLLQVESVNPALLTIDEVVSVSGTNLNTRQTTEYLPVNQSLAKQENSATFDVNFKPSVNNEMGDCYLSLFDPNADIETQGTETLTARVIYSNGHTAEKIQPGELIRGSRRNTYGYSCLNLHKPTDYYPVNLHHRDKGWELLGLLTTNIFSELTLDRLKTIMRLELNLLQGMNKETYSKQIESIVKLELEQQSMLYRGTPLNGYAMKLIFSYAGWASIGEIYVFSQITNFMLLTKLSIDTFLRLEISIEDSGDSFVWPAQTIDKILA